MTNNSFTLPEPRPHISKETEKDKSQKTARRMGPKALDELLEIIDQAAQIREASGDDEVIHVD